MQFLGYLHDRFGFAMLILMLICGLWALALWVFRKPMSGGLLAAVILGEALILAQGLLGVILMIMGGQPQSSIHWIYGIAAALCLPVANQYLMKRSARTRLLFLGIVCLFIVALGVRGFMTSGVLG